MEESQTEPTRTHRFERGKCFVSLRIEIVRQTDALKMDWRLRRRRALGKDDDERGSNVVWLVAGGEWMAGDLVGTTFRHGSTVIFATTYSTVSGF